MNLVISKIITKMFLEEPGTNWINFCLVKDPLADGKSIKDTKIHPEYI